MTGLHTIALLAFAPAAQNAVLQPLIMFPLIFIVFWLLTIRPQQQQRKRHEQALRTLKKGDEVVTAGGIVGEVVHIREMVKDGTAQQALEDRVTIKSGESRLVVERGRIVKIQGKSEESSTAA